MLVVWSCRSRTNAQPGGTSGASTDNAAQAPVVAQADPVGGRRRGADVAGRCHIDGLGQARRPVEDKHRRDTHSGLLSAGPEKRTKRPSDVTSSTRCAVRDGLTHQLRRGVPDLIEDTAVIDIAVVEINPAGGAAGEVRAVRFEHDNAARTTQDRLESIARTLRPITRDADPNGRATDVVTHKDVWLVVGITQNQIRCLRGERNVASIRLLISRTGPSANPPR